MKNFYWLFIICFVFFVVGCDETAIKAGFQDDLKSLKIIKTDPENKTIWYVPTKTVIKGMGTGGKMAVAEMGQKKLIQGMIKLAADEEEIKLLSEQAKKLWGQTAQIKRSLNTDVDMKITFNGKKLWQHSIMSGNTNGLPLQLIIPKDQKGELTVSMDFTSEKFMSKKTVQVHASGFKQQESLSGTVKSSSTEATASISISGSKNQDIGNFQIEHKIKIE